MRISDWSSDVCASDLQILAEESLRHLSSGLIAPAHLHLAGPHQPIDQPERVLVDIDQDHVPQQPRDFQDGIEIAPGRPGASAALAVPVAIGRPNAWMALFEKAARPPNTLLAVLLSAHHLASPLTPARRRYHETYRENGRA